MKVIARNRASLPHVNVFQFVLIFCLLLAHFCHVFCPHTKHVFSPISFILTLLTKALRLKLREVFLSILGSCYTTLDAIMLDRVYGSLKNISGY